MKKITFILFGFLAYGSITAQQKAEIPHFVLTGSVTDSTGVPLYPATVTYSTGKGSLETLTDAHGQYRFTRVNASSFNLSITMKGYAPYIKVYQIHHWKPTENLAPIRLPRSFGDLEPVVITAIRPVTATQDTLTFHVSAFPIRPGSEVEDILRILPGVEVDMNGHVIVQGKTIDHVMVNGKDFFGGDVLLAIRNLPADVVDKLQIIDDYGDKARLTGVRSGDPAKVLNIVLRSDRRQGTFGRLNSTLGDQSKYAAGAFANAFDGERQASMHGSISNNTALGSDLSKGAGFDFADKWSTRWSSSIHFQTNMSDPITQTQTSSLSRYPFDTLLQTQNAKSTQHQSQSVLSSRVTYTPDHYTSLRLSLSWNSTSSHSLQINQFTTTQTDSGFTKSTQGNSAVQSPTTGQTLNVNVYFEKTLPNSRRRYTLESSLAVSNSQNLSDNQTGAMIQTTDSTSPSFLHSRTTTHSPSSNTNIAATYFLPIGVRGFLDIGYRLQSTFTQTNLQTQAAYTPTSALQPVDSLSQQIYLRNISQNGHLGYSSHFKSIDLTTNLEAQPGLMTGTADQKGDDITYKYFSLIPQAQLAWSVNTFERLSLNYFGTPTLPSLQQLSPITNLTNPQYPVSGNPHLTEAYTHNVTLDFEHSQQKGYQYFGYGIVANYSVTEHPINVNLTTPENNSLVIQETTYQNTGSTHLLALNFHLILPTLLHRKLKIMLSGNISRNQVFTITDSLEYPTVNWTWTPTLHFLYLVTNRITVDLTANYGDTRTTYPGTSSGPQVSRTALLNLDTYHYFGRKWMLHYLFQQSYTDDGTRLQTVPPSLTASLQRQFLARNQITVTLAGFNLLGQHTTTTQTGTPTTVTQTTPQLTGRYLQVSFLWKPQHFPVFHQSN